MKDRIELNSNAISLRNRFGIDVITSPIEIMSFINSSKGITLVFHPFTGGISGMSYRITANNSMIAVNSNMSYGRQRYTIAHELYHLNFQDDFKFVVCSQDLWGQQDEEEKNADIFASYFLAPFDGLRLFIDVMIFQDGIRRPLEIDDVVKIEQYFGMSRQATLYRLCADGYLKWDDIEPLKKNVIQSARKLGYDERLYRPTPPEFQISTTGSLIGLADQAFDQDIISKGKYEEILLNAYRDDIVYNYEFGGQVYD